MKIIVLILFLVGCAPLSDLERTGVGTVADSEEEARSLSDKVIVPD